MPEREKLLELKCFANSDRAQTRTRTLKRGELTLIVSNNVGDGRGEKAHRVEVQVQVRRVGRVGGGERRLVELLRVEREARARADRALAVLPPVRVGRVCTAIQHPLY